MTGNIGIGFRSADGDLCRELVHCLDFMNDLAFFKAYKSHSWQSLRIESGNLVVDVGCGTGSDLIHLAKQHPEASFIGIDKSESFLSIAKERAAPLTNIQLLQGDAQQLPLENRAADAIRIDRSLQHMEAPAAFLKEMARVTKAGGRIVACEPDWETFILFNGDYDDSQEIAHFFMHSIRNSFIGRELASLANECGIKNLRTHVHAFWTNRLEEAAIVFDLDRVKDQCAAADRITQDDADNWWSLSQHSSQKGTFFASLNIVETSGIIS
jgi:ubiquinone/menaquinone biosynthesis C-methylase UbiE